jgi:MFS family permease
MRDQRWLFAWGIGSLSAGAASLLVPLYLVQLGADSFDLGVLGAVAAFVAAPGGIFWGRLADRSDDARRITVASAFGIACVFVLVPFLSSIALVIVANALLWLLYAALGPVLTLLVVADVPEDAWNERLASFNRYQGYGWAAGLVLGIAWSATVGQFLPAALAQRYLFVASGVLAAVAALAFGLWVPAPAAKQIDRVNPSRVVRAFGAGRRGVRDATAFFLPHRLYWRTRGLHPRRLSQRFTPTLATYFLGVVLVFTGFAAFFAPLPLYLSNVGFSADAVFALYFVSSLGAAVFSTKAGSLATEFDVRKLHTGALGLRGLSMPLVAVAGGTLAAGLVGTIIAGVLFVLIGVAWAVIAVTAGTIVTRLAPKSIRGEALGLYAALSAFAGGIGSIAGGAIANAVGFPAAFASAGLVILAGAGLVLSLRGISERTKTPDSIGGLQTDD